ncbi:hypothetical protein EB796_005954 [Bugula neritina]|uniref:Uncharacterized protein n=1 Tax=Bugula neritina TaxID=10212 RepID=A0A7J7KBY2_BUGNE|nr:hypothetical protein EB796_005954 [Bugula neritina]
MPQVSLKRTAAISNLPIDNVTQPLTVLYGDPNKTFTGRYDPVEYIDGDNDTLMMIRIGHIYQTSDQKYIYFVDQRSCVRQLDRMAVNLTTIIGKGHCGNSTLGFDSSTDARDVYGMTYYEAADTFFISVQDNGVYTFSRTSPQLPYTQTGLLPLSEISTTISDGIGDMLTVGDIVWQKVGEGLNRYEVSGYKTNKNTILDFSSSGNAERYLRYHKRTAAVSTPEGVILQHPSNPDWLCILDKKYASLFFYNIVDDALIRMCSKGTTSQDGTADVCTLKDLIAGVWVSETLMIVYETNKTMKEILWSKYTV